MQRHLSRTRMFICTGRTLAACIFIVGLVTACNECNECPSGPNCATGAIHGHVLGGGKPLEATIRTGVPRDTPGLHGSFATSTDSLGRYRLELPDGNYILQLSLASGRYYYSSHGIVSSEYEADTLRIAAGSDPIRADFTLGALEVRVELALDLPDRVADLWLARRDSAAGGWDRFVALESSWIEGGIARFGFPGLLPGVYAMELYLGRTRAEFWLPNQRSVDSAETVEVEIGRTTRYEVVVATQPARISGEIVGSWQEMGLDQPWIFLSDEDSSFVADAQADWQGGFSIGLFFPARVRLLVRMGDFTRWIGGERYTDAEVFDLRLGEEISGIRLEESGLLIEIPLDDLPEVWDLIAELVHADDLAPLASHPRIYFDERSRLIPVPNLLPGDYLLRLRPRRFLRHPWLEQWHDRAADAAQATVISLGAGGEVVPVALHPERGATIYGTIECPPGDGRTFAWICLTRATSSEHLGIQHRGRSSTPPAPVDYALKGLADGDYKVGAWLCTHPEYECPPENVMWYPGTADRDSATVIEIRDHQDVDGIILEFPQ